MRFAQCVLTSPEIRLMNARLRSMHWLMSGATISLWPLSRLKRLEIYPATESAGTRSPFPMVVEDVEKLPRDYRLKLVSEKTDKVLVMKPRDADSPFTEVRIRFRDGRIAGVEQKDRRGNRVVLEITEFDVDAEISDDDIELSIPSGTKVVRFGETAADRATGSPREKKELRRTDREVTR